MPQLCVMIYERGGALRTGGEEFMDSVPWGEGADMVMRRSLQSRVGDNWRMGLPLEILLLLVSVPMILLVWPL